MGMLGFSTGEIVGTSLAALVLLGPKEVPAVMKILGTSLGKAVAYSHVYKRKFDRIVEEGGVKELHAEMRMTKSEFDKVYLEIKGEMNPMRNMIRSEFNASSSASRTDDAAASVVGFVASDGDETMKREREEMREKLTRERRQVIFEGISAKAVGRDLRFNDSDNKNKNKNKNKNASTVLLEALAEEEVAREALRFSEKGGLVDEHLSKTKNNR
jgi:Sec-independent protein translocase protein TatA